MRNGPDMGCMAACRGELGREQVVFQGVGLVVVLGLDGMWFSLLVVVAERHEVVPPPRIFLDRASC